MNNDYYGWGMGMGCGFPFMGLIFFALIIMEIVVIMKSIFGRQNNDEEITQDNQSTALDILKKRYARGEIDQDEFEKMKEDIK